MQGLTAWDGKEEKISPWLMLEITPKSKSWLK
jgi:hypothetical protein